MSRTSLMLLLSISLPMVASVVGYLTVSSAYYEREIERLAQPFDPEDLRDPEQRECAYRILEAWNESSQDGLAGEGAVGRKVSAARSDHLDSEDANSGQPLPLESH